MYTGTGFLGVFFLSCWEASEATWSTTGATSAFGDDVLDGNCEVETEADVTYGVCAKSIEGRLAPTGRDAVECTEGHLLGPDTAPLKPWSLYEDSVRSD